MVYVEHGIRLTDGQKKKLARAYEMRYPIVLRLKYSQLNGQDMILTNTQLNKIRKSISNKTGADIKISGTQIREQRGGFLGPLLSTVGRVALPLLSKAVGPLVTGALSGLSSLGVNKLFGNGLFSVPQDKVDKLISYKDYLNAAQKKQILAALQSGSGIRRFKLTKTQQGGFLGTLLVSIGIPLLMKAITGRGRGRGLQVEPGNRGRNTKNVFVLPKPIIS